jgi:hypothetical protein
LMLYFFLAVRRTHLLDLSQIWLKMILS